MSFYTLSLESKKNILRQNGIYLLNRNWIDCNDLTFFEMLNNEIHLKNN